MPKNNEQNYTTISEERKILMKKMEMKLTSRKHS
jgi:hypothetical protein